MHGLFCTSPSNRFTAKTKTIAREKSNYFLKDIYFFTFYLRLAIAQHIFDHFDILTIVFVISERVLAKNLMLQLNLNFFLLIVTT